MTLEEYYRTEHWKAIREERLEYDNYTCTECSQTRDDGVTLQVHHYPHSYRVLGHETMADLVTRCRKCHHDLYKRRKRLLKRSGKEGGEIYLLQMDVDEMKKAVEGLRQVKRKVKKRSEVVRPEVPKFSFKKGSK